MASSLSSSLNRTDKLDSALTIYDL